MRVRKKISILGRINGKIFLQYIFSLANQHAISGWTKSRIGFVEIEAEGAISSIIEFICIIHDFSKQLSFSVEIRFHDVKVLNSVDFRIIENDSTINKESLLTNNMVIYS